MGDEAMEHIFTEETASGFHLPFVILSPLIRGGAKAGIKIL